MAKHWIRALLVFALAFPVCLPVLPASVSEPLIMGVIPRRNAKQTTKLYKPFVTYLQSKLGRPVKLETTYDFNNFWNGVSTLRYDLVHFNQYHYVRSHKKLGYNVIAMSEESGKSKIAGTLTVKKDSGLKSLQELKGQKIIFGGGPKAMMSYIVPTYLLRQAGLMQGDYQEEFAKNPPNALLAVYYGQAVAAGVGDSVIDLETVKAKCDTQQFVQLAKSVPLNHLPWAVKPGISPVLQTKIQTILLEMKSTKEGQDILQKMQVTGLLPAQDSDYDEHRKIIEVVSGEKY